MAATADTSTPRFFEPTEANVKDKLADNGPLTALSLADQFDTNPRNIRRRLYYLERTGAVARVGATDDSAILWDCLSTATDTGFLTQEDVQVLRQSDKPATIEQCLSRVQQALTETVESKPFGASIEPTHLQVLADYLDVSRVQLEESGLNDVLTLIEQAKPDVQPSLSTPTDFATARKDASLTQSEVANAIEQNYDVSMSQWILSRFENGHREISDAQRDALRAVYASN